MLDGGEEEDEEQGDHSTEQEAVLLNKLGWRFCTYVNFTVGPDPDLLL